MVGFDFDSSVIMAQSRILEKALSTNPDTQKALRKLIQKVIKDARDETVARIRFKGGDPRGAAQSVRRTVYRKILGANLNIYNSRKAGKPASYEPPRKGSSGRGGNRKARSARTNTIMHYGPHDRGFILRWINSGAHDRKIKFTPNPSRKADKWNTHPNSGNRGSIAARHFFRGAGEQSLVKATDTLADLVDTELDKLLNKNNPGNGHT